MADERMHAITGTREGGTAAQCATLERVMEKLAQRAIQDEVTPWWVHGDCIGIDSLSHGFARKHFHIAIYPSDSAEEKNRAFCERIIGFGHLGGHSYLPRPSLVRNRLMVDISIVLVALPKTEGEELRSGTWATIRYARSIKTPHLIIWPDGRTASVRYAEAS